MMGDDMAAGKLLDLAAVAVNSAAADLAAASAESDGEEEHACSWSRTGSGATNVYEEGEGSEGDEEDNGVGGKQKRALPTDSERRARNRERNRLHARKTRQRKKQHVQELQLKIWGLRQERQRLLQLSTDHRTAGVLLALSCSPKQCIQGAGPLSAGSPRVPSALELPDAATKAAAGRGRDWSREVASHEEALRKITQEFESMDGSQQLGEEEGETGALIAVRDRAQSSSSSSSSGGGGGCKGGSRGVKGTLSDRTALRRERNRMHAKRTRNRKKLFVEACSVMIDKMVSHISFFQKNIYPASCLPPLDARCFVFGDHQTRVFHLPAFCSPNGRRSWRLRLCFRLSSLSSSTICFGAALFKLRVRGS